MFKAASDHAFTELEHRKKTITRLMRFGVQFLDDALRGIFPDDLILLGAPSGVGKTQLCCNIALANMNDGKRVHYIALEASEFEIERRLKFPIVMDQYYGDPERPRMGKVGYTDWLLGKHIQELEYYETQAAILFEKKHRNLFLFYKEDRFGLTDLIEKVSYVAKETDLIIVDHVHYFDFDDDNENRAIREIAKTVRTLSLEKLKPIILVAHLRKKDRNSDDLVAGLDEFHGSSDLYKIATRVITVAPGQMNSDGTFNTYFRIPKNRLDGGVTRFSAKEFFDPKIGGYLHDKYEIGYSSQSRSTGFESIDNKLYPEWARQRPDPGRSNRDHVPQKPQLWFAKD